MDSSRTLVSMDLESVAAGFAALGDPLRIRILRILEAGERCVCDLREGVDIAPNLLSYHLKVLRQAGLVRATRRGRWVDYRLAGPALETLRQAVPREAAG